MIVADSSVWIDYFSGRYTREANLLDSLLTQQPILPGDLIVTEVLQGCKQDRHFMAAKEKSAPAYKGSAGRKSKSS